MVISLELKKKIRIFNYFKSYARKIYAEKQVFDIS